MAGGRVLADTTLFIAHLRAKDKSGTELYRLARAVEVETSSIVAAEIFYGARKAGSEANAREVLALFPIHPFTQAMAARIGAIVQELRKQNRIPDLRDAMIAATALELSLPVATLNRGHFESVPGLALHTLGSN